MKELIKRFKRHAKKLKRDSNSINELKLWVTAHRTEEWDKIMEENNNFKDFNAYDIIKLLREKYKLGDEEMHYFLKQYVLNPSPVKETATMELDRTEGRPGTSNEEFREDLIGIG